MNPTQLLPLLRRYFVAAAFAAVAFAGAPGAWGQTPSLEPAPRPPQRGTPAFSPPAGNIVTAAPADDFIFLPTAEEQQEKSDGSQQNIKMHGHWLIDVKNPDGSLAQHRDFENSLYGGGPGGPGFLIALMAGYVVPADYAISLFSNTNTTPCSNQSACVLVRSLTTQPGVTYCQSFTCFTGLTYGYNVGVTGNPSLVLSGSFTASSAGTIDSVFTVFGVCPGAGPTGVTGLSTVSPSACPAASGSTGSNNQLSGTNLSSTVSVSSGQIVQVTVTITFS